MKTRQEAFDKVVEHLLKQGKRSAVVTESSMIESCMYRGPNGLKCAIGALIFDEYYSKILEGKAIDTCATAAIVASGYPGDNLSLSLYASLQLVHDYCDPDGWPSALRSTANKYKLEWNHD